MGIRDLLFSITARDKTGGAFGSVNRSLRETSGAAATASQRIDRVGQRLTRAGAAGSLASAGIFAMFRDSVGLYDQQARSEAKIQQAIEATGGAAGFTAEQLLKEASSLQRLTRVGDEDILNKVTAQFLTFKNISGEVFLDAQTAALDLATTLDGDLQSASIMLGKALNDPVAGLSAMSRAGVTFTKDQQDMVKSMVEAGDVLGAQRLILDEIAGAYGGQAEAARKAGAGVYEAWKNTWGDIKEIVGRELVAGMTAVLPVLESLVGKFENLSPRGQRFVVVMGALAVAVPPLTAALGAMLIGLAAVSGPIGALILGASAATAALVTFWPEVKAAAASVRDFLAPALEVGGAVVSAVGDTFARVFGAIPQIVGSTVTAVGEWITGKFNGILQGLGEKVEWVEGKFAWLYDRVVGNSWVPDMVDEIGVNFDRLQSTMVEPSDRAIGAVEGGFRDLMSDIGSHLSGTITGITGSWGDFWGGLYGVSQSWADRILTDVFDRLGTGMMDAITMPGGALAGGGGGGGLGIGGILGGVGSWAKNLIGFANGGEFSVRGRAGYDRNIASVKLSEGERVKVERKGGDGGSMRPINVYIQTPSPAAFQASRAQIGQQISRAVSAGGRTA